MSHDNPTLAGDGELARLLSEWAVSERRNAERNGSACGMIVGLAEEAATRLRSPSVDGELLGALEKIQKCPLPSWKDGDNGEAARMWMIANDAVKAYRAKMGIANAN
jgi:hypothetical protein